jgi:hypothetical protein
VSRPALGPTQPPVQWVPWVLSPGVKRGRGVTLTTPHLVSRMSRSYIFFPPSASMACSGTALPFTTVRGEKYGKGMGGARWRTVCLSMYSKTENIYCSQLSSVAILLQPEPVSHRIIQGKDCVLSPSVLSSSGLPPPPRVYLQRSMKIAAILSPLYTHLY